MKNNIQKNIYPLIIGFASGCGVIILLYSVGFFNLINGPLRGSPITADSRLETGKYKFIKPILNSGYGNEEEALKWFPAERKMKTLVQDVIAENPNIETGVFFLNLKNSGWFSVNASNTFIPASLLKLPMLMSYFKLSETEKDLFDQKITYEGKDFNSTQNLGNGTIIPGNTYSIKELMEEMIINSDNNALQLLYKYRKDSLRSIFDDMKIPLPYTDDEIASKDFVTTRDIGRFLLVLYNASYLTPGDSEEALKILSKAVFKDGIAAGIPSDITVSNKYGERQLMQGEKSLRIELHDCGIVYHPRTPYILCVMTKGGDLDSEKLHIQKISKKIYDAVDDFSRANSKK